MDHENLEKFMRFQIEKWERNEPRSDWWAYQRQYAEAADAIADLRARNEALVKVIARSTEGWENAVELGLIPPQHRNTATILADEGRAALAANREG